MGVKEGRGGAAAAWGSAGTNGVLSKLGHVSKTSR